MPRIKLPFITVLTLLMSSGTQADEISANFEKWLKARPENYSYVIEVGCYCPWSITAPILFEISGDPIALAYVESEIPVTDLAKRHIFIGTIEYIFGELTRISMGKPEILKIEYDTDYGFPVTVDVDRSKTFVDDKVSLKISKFEGRKGGI